MQLRHALCLLPVLMVLLPSRLTALEFPRIKCCCPICLSLDLHCCRIADTSHDEFFALMKANTPVSPTLQYPTSQYCAVAVYYHRSDALLASDEPFMARPVHGGSHGESSSTGVVGPSQNAVEVCMLLPCTCVTAVCQVPVQSDNPLVRRYSVGRRTRVWRRRFARHCRYFAQQLCAGQVQMSMSIGTVFTLWLFK